MGGDINTGLFGSHLVELVDWGDEELELLFQDVGGAQVQELTASLNGDL